MMACFDVESEGNNLQLKSELENRIRFSVKATGRNFAESVKLYYEENDPLDEFFGGENARRECLEELQGITQLILNLVVLLNLKICCGLMTRFSSGPVHSIQCPTLSGNFADS